MASAATAIACEWNEIRAVFSNPGAEDRATGSPQTRIPAISELREIRFRAPSGERHGYTAQGPCALGEQFAIDLGGGEIESLCSRTASSTSDVHHVNSSTTSASASSGAASPTGRRASR